MQLRAFTLEAGVVGDLLRLHKYLAKVIIIVD